MVAQNAAPVLRQAVLDVVRALLTGVPGLGRGSTDLHEATTRLATQHDAGAMTDLDDGAAANLAQSLGMLAVSEGQHTLAVLNSRFHDIPQPDTATSHPAATGDDDEDLGLDGRQVPSSGMARR